MSLFHFKQFTINQEGCPMKINTDGVLLGAMVELEEVKTALDIGTGTGVIALMMAQRSHSLQIDAIDIDRIAFQKSSENFESSLFHLQIKAHHHSFKEYFELNPTKKYDSIVSNPPYFLNSLKSPKATKTIAKHTDEHFFIDLIAVAKNHLTGNGRMTLVLPIDISMMMQNLASDYGLSVIKCINIKSYDDKAIIRHIISFGKLKTETEIHEFTIYAAQGEYSLAYKALLKDFFKIF